MKSRHISITLVAVMELLANTRLSDFAILKATHLALRKKKTLGVSFSSERNNDEKDRTSLLDLRDGFIAGGSSQSTDEALNSWNASLHFCQWRGVTCGKKHRRVTEIDLSGQMLKGVISPSVGNLTFLRSLYLRNNLLRGELPTQIGQLRRIQYLDLGMNYLQGQIPVELSNCSTLLWLGLHANNFTGEIPYQFSSLSKINVFYAQQNSLVGELPRFFRNLSSLSQLYLADNKFHGEIQDSLQGLSKLKLLSLPTNNLSGSVSPLYNLSSLQYLDVARNHFTGTLAQDMDVRFPNLTFLSFSYNNFTGTIPPSISNMSGLYVIQLGGNKLTGRVPDNLGKLGGLKMLQISDNLLGSEQAGDLNFIASLSNCTELKWLVIAKNRFGGQLPDFIGNLTSKLQEIQLRENYITGSLPEAIGELSGLTFMELGKNLFTDTIPISIGKLLNVNTLLLYENSFRGGIPSSIGNMRNLSNLDLSTNLLDGTIPEVLGNCRDMQVINISGNHLSGNLPSKVFSQFQNLRSCNVSYNSFSGAFPAVFERLEALNTLDASYNNFSGEFRAQLGYRLELLNIAGNSFNGSIPSSLGSLRALQWLDLSNNNLSGVIPKELTYIATLQNLNLSYNQLEGEVPLFNKSSRLSVVGNMRLCGGNQELKLQPCKHRLKRKTISKKSVIFITLGIIAMFTLFICLFILFCIRRKYKKDSRDELPEGYQRVTYAELFKATDGFAESNLIGSGSFGDVYRGTLNGDETKQIAVKVLNMEKYDSTKSFNAECKVLKEIRHRNLLRIITSCSSLDFKGNDFKALVFDLMSNGNLDNCLHYNDEQRQEVRVPLSLAKRLEVAIDVGSALDYLHNGCEKPIVHCDLKPSNILLDDDMIAHVGDFGLAKMLLGENQSTGESLSTAIKGSIGYVAPEYGMGAPISPQGDIYSYGILLLELITGKRPTDEMFNNETSIRNFSERALPEHVEEIVDQSIMNEFHEAIATQRNPEQFKLQWHTWLVSFVEVGISCSAESTRSRMDIQSAIRCLQKTKVDMIASLHVRRRQ
uniref:non-specific serine/threonine protein kinase n=1 Tax=Sedum alfredii TaxID=439688 RepID=A0A410N6B8_9MAGN|nr:LRR receptor-like serine/threonine-protein kinase EFR [Sedum alfredii]